MKNEKTTFSHAMNVNGVQNNLDTSDLTLYEKKKKKKKKPHTLRQFFFHRRKNSHSGLEWHEGEKNNDRIVIFGALSL